ncbi:hypothetical protein K456DRAFT_136769 [Colletotrichum gloeosporioides 23]|nr:hypothetical protein K456DRAFT_136769 [Colletotrichum gloeosporioides 23]
MVFAKFLPLTLLAGLALASPVAVRNNNATAILLAVAPTSSTCDGAAFPDECATAEHAAQFVPAAMQKYAVYRPGEIAALLSLMAFETGDFKYNRNHYPAPGRPGQGTRNLQMPKYNLLYALSIPELKDKATAIAGSADADGSTLSDDKKNEVLALVCDQSTRDELAEGTVRGFTLYMECIGTSGTEDRVAYWTRAKAAFGLA